MGIATATGAAAIVPARSAAAAAAAVDASTAVGRGRPSADALTVSTESPPSTASVPSMGAEEVRTGTRDLPLGPSRMPTLTSLESWMSALFSEEVAESFQKKKRRKQDSSAARYGRE